MLFIFSLQAYASEIIVVNEYEVRFRKEATTQSAIIDCFNPGVELTLLDKNGGTGNGCNSVWYKGQYGSQVGYICSEFVTIETKEEEPTINPEDFEDYSEYLKELGFPETYINQLINLHAKHPTWEFQILNVDYDFEKFIQKEYDGYYKGWSLLEDTANYYDGYKSFDNWSYNYLDNTFNNNFTGGGKYWYAASKKTIGYYLDPRNFLNEQQIFMFETLSYNSSYHTKEGIELMLKGTFMDNAFSDEPNNKTFADAFLDASLKYNISPYVLISRVIQEVGPQGSTIVTGTVAGYEGYYNFYNINAAGNTAEETINNGLQYAKEKGWDTKYKAIIGGASFLVKSYIEAGQDTLYLQKWDVIGPEYVSHQYMQNIQAPYTESIKTYRGYQNLSLIDSKFVFTIPVFKNMPSETKLPNSGNPNNYLSSLAVNGSYLFDKATTQTEFELNLDGNTTSVEISATKVYGKSIIKGTGTISLNQKEQIVNIEVLAENGDIRVYSIKITRNEEQAIAISEIIRLSNIKSDGTYLSGFTIGTDISTIKKTIIDAEPKAEVISVDKDGKNKTEGSIASGDKIKIKTNSEEKEYTIIIYGDVNADGTIDKLDYLQILRHFYKYTSLDGFYKDSADVNKDGTIDKLDYLAVLRDYYNYAKIEQ
jgi:beta-N-acetylglucosaminidase